jgi:hypothetical protein
MRTEVAPSDTAQSRGSVYWNPQVRAAVDAAAEYAVDDEAGPASLRAQGFTVVNAVPQLGIFRGRTAAVSLSSGPVADRVIRPNIAQAVALSRDNRLGFTYPTSSMGAITFIRQTLHDADWHARAHAAYQRNPQRQRPETNAALAALTPVVRAEQPVIFDARSEEEVLRALRFREDYPLRLWVRASGASTGCSTSSVDWTCR